MALKKQKTSRSKPQNRYAKSAKYSEYKVLQLIECFARDYSVQQAARATKITERTVRDRYADIRSRLFKWCIDFPDLFNGFGHMLLDENGSINLHVLEMLFYYSESETFKKRMAERYPKFKTEKDAALQYVIELAIRRFTSVELPSVNDNFVQAVKDIFAASHAETILSVQNKDIPDKELRRFYWQKTSKRLRDKEDISVRQFPKTEGETMFRDIKYMLRRDPL